MAIFGVSMAILLVPKIENFQKKILESIQNDPKRVQNRKSPKKCCFTIFEPCTLKSEAMPGAGTARNRRGETGEASLRCGEAASIQNDLKRVQNRKSRQKILLENF